jgi:hypothetical protein
VIGRVKLCKRWFRLLNPGSTCWISTVIDPEYLPVQLAGAGMS